MNTSNSQEHPLLQGLNERQQQAVITTEGPVLVIAGAGSGKTRALTHRVAYLMTELAIPGENILAVTFTNKAAQEMRDRITKLVPANLAGSRGNMGFGGPSQLPTIGTFHSVCVRILRKHIHLLNFENQFTIYDTADQLILMKHLLEDLKMNEKELNPKAVLAQISNAKNKLITPREFEAHYADSYFGEKVARLYGPYQERLQKNNAVDFDDILSRTIQLFQEHPEVLKFYQEKFYYIHVDEYQDTNHSQYMITAMLAKQHRNLYAIGDHDQSIYSWRGANIQNILDFEKEYPDAKIITLDQNYRSTQQILNVAQSVIIKNTQRKDKSLWTNKTTGSLTRLCVAENERHEGEIVAQEIQKEIKQQESPTYKQFVILYRTNAQSRSLEEVFMRNGIPYKIIGGIRFYERKEIKDILAYLKLISNPADSVSLLRIVNTPQRSIGPKTLEVIQAHAFARNCTLLEAMMYAEEIPDLSDSKKLSVVKFARMIYGLQKSNKEVHASALIKYVLDETGYKMFINDGSVEAESRLENIAELVSVASKYDKFPPGISLTIFLEEVALIADIDSMDQQENAVTLMTVHAAKGLEFPWVFICGLEEGLMPHSRALLSPEELEEERRLFYVACTRAEERLFLLYTRNRMIYGDFKESVPSQFISDIPENLLEKAEEQYGSRRSMLFGNLGMRRTQAGVSTGFGNRQIPSEATRSPTGFATAKSLGRSTDGNQNSRIGTNGANLDTGEEENSTAVEFLDGDRVNHKLFGDGIVVSATGGVVTVAFKDPKIGIKKLAVSVAPLEKI